MCGGVQLDWCGLCTTVLGDIASMQAGMEATGRSMRLVVEGNPPVDVISANPRKYGNARRVGHDIYASWLSMLSLVDVGSGLWPFAHNDTGLGGFFNDLDMMEVGNGEFNETADARLNLNRAHFTMWIIMKAPILLGTRLELLSANLTALLTNRDALGVHQDALGNQGRRVSSQPPQNAFKLSAPQDAVLALVPCDASRPTQTWHYNESTGWIWALDADGVAWCMGPSDVWWGRPSVPYPCSDPAYAYNASTDCSAPEHICNQISSAWACLRGPR